MKALAERASRLEFPAWPTDPKEAANLLVEKGREVAALLMPLMRIGCERAQRDLTFRRFYEWTRSCPMGVRLRLVVYGDEPDYHPSRLLGSPSNLKFFLFPVSVRKNGVEYVVKMGKKV